MNSAAYRSACKSRMEKPFYLGNRAIFSRALAETSMIRYSCSLNLQATDKVGEKFGEETSLGMQILRSHQVICVWSAKNSSATTAYSRE